MHYTETKEDETLTPKEDWIRKVEKKLLGLKEISHMVAIKTKLKRGSMQNRRHWERRRPINGTPR